MLNHFFKRVLDHESYTHEKRRGKIEQKITKWKNHLQSEKNTAPMEHNKTESDLSDQEKNPLNYYALLGALLCHCLIAPALQAAGSKRSLVTPPPPPPPPPRRDPCSRTAGDLKSRFQSSAEAGLPPRILGYLTKLATYSRVYKTGGNRSSLTGYRSNRSGPVTVPAGTQPAKIQILKLNSKNEKFTKNS